MSYFNLKYGKEKVKFISDNWQGSIKIDKLINNQVETESRSLTKIVEHALNNPIGSPKLKNMLKKDDKIAIIISDITRSWQQINIFLPILIERINKLGIPDQNIKLIAATGSHRKHSEAEKEKLIGKDLAKRFVLIDHDCNDKSQLVWLGQTSLGTPLWFNKDVYGADQIIVTGGIVYHDLAGWSGGRKSILPGIAGYQTIMANHALALTDAGEIKETVKSGNLKTNPVHLDMMEATNFIRPSFILNVIPNAKGEIDAVVAGDFLKAHQEGCKIVSKNFDYSIDKKADLVIASCGGFPKDINLYQASKGLINAASVVKKNGYVILLAKCSEGFGHPGVEKMINDFSNNRQREAFMLDNFTIAYYSGYLITKAMEKINLILVSDNQAIKKTNLKVVENLKSAMEIVTEGVEAKLTTYLMPDAASILPVEKERDL